MGQRRYAGRQIMMTSRLEKLLSLVVVEIPVGHVPRALDKLRAIALGVASDHIFVFEQGVNVKGKKFVLSFTHAWTSAFSHASG